MFTNAIYYNGRHTEVGSAAKELMDYFEVSGCPPCHDALSGAQDKYGKPIARLVKSSSRGRFQSKRSRRD